MKYGNIVQDLADRGQNWQFYDEACLPRDKLQKCVEFIIEFLRLKKVKFCVQHGHPRKGIFASTDLSHPRRPSLSSPNKT